MDADKFEYFMDRTASDFERVEGKIDSLASKVDSLRLFEARVLAIVTLVTIVLAPAVTLLTLYLRPH